MTVDAANLRRIQRFESQAVGPRDELKLRFNLVKSVLAPPQHAQVTVDFARRRQLQRGGGIAATAVVTATVTTTVATTVATLGIAAAGVAIRARRQLPSPAND